MNATNSLRTILLTAGVVGAGGWFLENAFARRNDNPEFRGLPFLPVYAAGGAAIALIEPVVRDLHPLEKVAVYGGMLTGIEALAGALDSAAGRQSWNYGNGRRVDLPHSALWGVLGFLAGEVVRGANK